MSLRAHRNLLLDSLPSALRAAVLAQSQHVVLPFGTELFASMEPPLYVHFLTSGVASVVTMMASGEAVETGLTGREGLPEKYQLLGPQVGNTRCFMQLAGSAYRMSFTRFRLVFLANPALADAVFRNIQQDALVLGQLAACNRLHDVEARLARWLLMVHDRVQTPEIRLTQELLGEMLGARRSSVNLAAASLQRAGHIGYSRGVIRILSREGLEGAVCECYGTIARLFRQMYS